MLRLFSLRALVLGGVMLLLIFTAMALGRTRDGDIIAYFGLTTTDAGGAYLLDVPHQISLRLIAADSVAAVGSQLIPNAQGDLFIKLCSSECSGYIVTRAGLFSIPVPFDFSGGGAWSSDGQLAFESCAIFTFCDMFLWDGVTLRNLSETPDVSEIYPSWSADGRLAFLSCREVGCLSLVVWDGQRLNEILDDTQMASGYASWNVDGRLAFSSGCTGDPRCDIIIWDGDTQQNLTPSADAVGTVPHWGSSGQLSYQSCTSAFVNCDVMLWTGTTTLNLTDSTAESVANLRWGSGGLAFVTSQGIQTRMRLWDGAELQTISQRTDAYMGSLAWSDDGQLAFLSCTQLGVCDLLRWDGETTHTLMQSLRITTGFLSWNASGHLLFMGCFDANADCDLMVWDGQNIIRLTNTPQLDEYFPVWLP